MKPIFLSGIAFLINITCFAQEMKRGNNWIIGLDPSIIFDFNSPFSVDTLLQSNFTICNSCISDKNGIFQFFSTGHYILSHDGTYMLNGDHVNDPYGTVLDNYYGGVSLFDQTSIILPKKGNTYYVFSTGMSDSVANNYLNHILTEFDVLNYSVVDMDSNGGWGKVVKKNVVLSDHQHYYYTPLTAVKHSNSKDWWLVKADCNNNRYQEFLVKEDTIMGPYYQNITTFGDFCTGSSQMYFSEDGTKLASTIYGNINGTSSNPFYYYNRVELYDFDRCSGEITYKQHYIVPYDTSTYVNRDFKKGICFSPDGKLLYMSTNYSIFQIDLEDTNTNNALYIHGPDTSDLAHFPLYGTMGIAPNGKIYVGNYTGTRKYMSYLDSPNVKGLGCSFVPHGVWQSYTNLMSPPNMPNYGLAADTSVICWPLLIENEKEKENEWVVYPNPACNKVIIKNAYGKEKVLCNALGQILYTTKKDEIDVSGLAKGLHFIRCDNITKRILVE